MRQKCLHRCGHVEHLAMSGTGNARFLERQTYRYGFVACKYCGYIAIFNLNVFKGKGDVRTILEFTFSD